MVESFAGEAFVEARKVLHLEIAVAMTRATGPMVIMSSADQDRVDANIKYVAKICGDMLLRGADDRLGRFWADFHMPSATYAMIASQLNALDEAMDDDIKYESFYHYPRGKFLQVVRAQGDWAAAIKALPDIKKDIEAGLDCFALGYELPCVFYLMRVMEIGVQRFGKKLKVSLTAKTATKLTDLTWHQILDRLNPNLKALPQKTPAQKAKHEKFSAIQAYLYAVKDAWRNPTMHPRKEGYSPTECENIISQVRSFMNELASVISS